MADPFKVLIAIDNSEHADFAFQYYMKHIHKTDNVVTLLHVAELPGNSIMYMSGSVWEETVQREKEKTVVLEKVYREKLEKYQLSAKIIANFANKPGETICKTAEDEGAYMIVLGSRGAGKIRRTIMGSVSDYVMHHAHCPVVICRHEAHHHHTSLLGRIRRLSSRSTSESEKERKASDGEREHKPSGNSRHSKSSESDRQRNISDKSIDSSNSSGGNAEVFEDKK